DTIDNVNELNKWRDLISTLNEDQLDRVFQDKIATEGSKILIQNIIANEKKKNEEDQNWESIIKSLNDLERVSKEWGFSLMAIRAARAKMEIQVESFGDYEKAYEIGNQMLKQYQEDQTASLIINTYKGKLMVEQRDYQESHSCFDRALSKLTHQILPQDQIESFMTASKVAAKNGDKKKALDYLQRAEDLAQKRPDIYTLDRVKVLGELTIAFIEKSDFEKAFTYAEKGLNLLLNNQFQPENLWKAIFEAFGHVSVYLTTLITTGEAPAKIPSGEEYAKPEIGIFIDLNEELEDYYRKGEKAFVTVHMSTIAGALGYFDKAGEWALLGLKIARKEDNHKAISPLGNFAIPHLLNKNHFKEAFSLILECSKHFLATGYLRENGENFLSADFKPNEILKKHDNNRSRLDYFLIDIGLLPSLFEIILLALESKQEGKEKAIEAIKFIEKSEKEISEFTSWQLFQDVVANLFDEDTGIEYFQHLENEYKEKNKKMHLILVKLAKSYFYKSEPVLALKEQLEISIDLVSRYENRKLYKVLMELFFLKFWQKVFHEEKYQYFGKRKLTKRKLDRLENSNQKSRIKETLKTVSSSMINFNLPQGILEELNESD
ncbi:MAG: hypothetical protein V5A57_03635, partial [Candidatus Paceibacterota bacterium]